MLRTNVLILSPNPRAVLKLPTPEISKITKCGVEDGADVWGLERTNFLFQMPTKRVDTMMDQDHDGEEKSGLGDTIQFTKSPLSRYLLPHALPPSSSC